MGTLRPPMALWFNWHLEGREHIPAEGPVLVACNHISFLDPMCQGYFLVKSGRRPRFLAKSELYRNRFLRTVLTGAGQIPVVRGSGAATPVDAAREALAAGECVVLYPEGTLTRNPDHSSMQAKTGIARLALATGVSVVPLAVWGSQYVLPRGMDRMKRSLSFGRPIMVKAGPPLDLTARAGPPGGAGDDRAELRQVTDAVMDELSRLIEDLRSRYPKRWVR